VTASACLWCAVVFLGVNLQSALGTAALARWGYVPSEMIYRAAFWGLITDAFVHFEPLHLLFNLYWLWIIGGAFEQRFGPIRLLLFMLTAAFVSSGIQLYDGMGVGLSGIGYALFGFAWIGRKRFPEFARVITDRTVQMFIGWGILCVVATYAHVMNIGNVAHLTGLAFGAAMCGLMLKPNLRVWLGAAIGALAAASIAVLFWNPFSMDWSAEQAYRAEMRHDYVKANRLLDRSLALGADPQWVWESKAQNYGVLHDKANYREALARLTAIDPESARSVVQTFGAPDEG
jgi:membrane associated rhomboid family serine protease